MTDRLSSWIIQYATETGRSNEWVARRVAEAGEEFRRAGSYEQTYDEVAMGRPHRVAQQRAMHRPRLLAQSGRP